MVQGVGEADPLGPTEPLTVTEVATLLRDLPAPWWIAGGWAIDLFLGGQTRPHHDLDVQILRRDQAAVRRLLAGWDVHLAGDGGLQPWPAAAWVAPPVHVIWVRTAPGTPWRFRRDARIGRPLADLGRRTAAGVPYIAPEVQLLYKAKAPRPHDEADFARAAPRLDDRQRAWLATALLQVHPDHAWLALLTALEDAG